VDASANVELIDASFSQSIQEEVSKTVPSARNDLRKELRMTWVPGWG